MGKISLKYGSGRVDYVYPSESHKFSINEPEFEIDKKRFYDALQDLLETSDQNYNKVAIVISDKTRLCDYTVYLPWLLEVIENKGAKKENITIYIAYGTHPRQSDEESLSSYGDAYRSYRFIHHDSNDDAVFAELGKTRRGTPVRIRKDILESTLIITYGAISHHYFAGYGGGRKLLFPGLAEKKSIYHNHSLFVDFANNRLSEGCQPGGLVGNPVAEDLKEIDGMLPDKLSIHGILNSKGKVCKFWFGNTYDDFVSACMEHNKYYSSGIGDTFDLVVASAGGYPKDINFIQSHKSMHNAASFVKNNGTLLLLAECRDGIGNENFLTLFREGGWDGIMAKLKNHYAGNGGTALATLSKTHRIKVKMVTSLSDEECNLMGVEKTDHQEANTTIERCKGTAAFIENASMLVK